MAAKEILHVTQVSIKMSPSELCIQEGMYFLCDIHKLARQWDSNACYPFRLKFICTVLRSDGIWLKLNYGAEVF